MSTIILMIGYAVSCTKENQVLDTPAAQVINSSTDLVSVKVTTPPTIDGTIEAMWENSPKLQISTVVPKVIHEEFRGYVGNIISSVTLRSAYDATNIYFLAEWADPTQSLLRMPWYFDPVTKQWLQESDFLTFNASGRIIRPAFYEDQMAFLWNIDNSVSGWNNATCYTSCHTDLPPDGEFGHYTNSPTERIDNWHWKAVRGGTNAGFTFDDQHMDNQYHNGRKGDAGGGGGSDNKQTLTITGSIDKVQVPRWVIPGRLNYGWILGTETTGATAVAKLITAVDANGVLSYSGGTIDANTDAGYQRSGLTVGAKSIPGVIVNIYAGSRGDIACRATYTGTGWILEFKRALKTADALKQDIDFSSLADQYFGVSIFENAHAAHGIKTNLILKFKK